MRVDADLGLAALLALNLDSQQQQLQLDETQPVQKNGLYDTEAYLYHILHTKTGPKIGKNSPKMNVPARYKGVKVQKIQMMTWLARIKENCKDSSLQFAAQLSPVTTLGFICSSIFVMISLSAVIKYTSLRPPNKK